MHFECLGVDWDGPLCVQAWKGFINSLGSFENSKEAPRRRYEESEIFDLRRKWIKLDQAREVKKRRRMRNKKRDFNGFVDMGFELVRGFNGGMIG